MQSKRFPDGEFVTENGGYSKHLIARADGGADVAWMLRAPTGGSNFLIGKPNPDGSPYHWVRENEDGTITVEPNPQDAPPERRNSNSILAPAHPKTGQRWHGYIHDGVWREC